MQTIRLGAPYKSKCGERKLASFKTYSHSACFLECWTRAIIDRCHCLTLGMAQLGEKMNCIFCMLFIWNVPHRTPSIILGSPVEVGAWRRVLPIITYKGRLYRKTQGVLKVVQKGFLFCQTCIQHSEAGWTSAEEHPLIKLCRLPPGLRWLTNWAQWIPDSVFSNLSLF